ncbi:MAG: hypothetical protein WCO94_04940 [Verrucomicrobiota bacterium]
MKTSSKNNWLLIGFFLAIMPLGYAAEDGAKISEDTKVTAKTEVSSNESSAEQVKAEQVKAEQVKAEQVKAEQVKAEQVKAEQVKAEQVKAEQIKVVSDKSDSEKQVKGSDKWALSKSAPAAPAPPFFALLAFGAVVGIRGLQKRCEAQVES